MLKYKFIIALIFFANTFIWNCLADEKAKPEDVVPKNAEGKSEGGVSSKTEFVPGKVHELTDDNFEDFIKANKNVLIKFYAPWCTHCKNLEPHFNEAAEKLKDNKNILLGRIDCTKHQNTANKYEIKGYPTLYFFRNGNKEEYGGGRQTEQILSWIEDTTSHPIREVADIDAHMKESFIDVSFVGKFKSKESKYYQVFYTTADRTRHLIKAYATFDENAPEEIYIRRLSDEDVKYEGTLDEKYLQEFVKSESFPLMGGIDEKNFRNYIDRGLEMIWVCGGKDEIEGHRKSIQEAAKEFKKEYSFVWLNTENYKQHAESALGVTEFPALVIQSKTGRYVIPNASEALKDKSKIVQFCNDVRSGKVEKSIKSENIPEKNDGPVFIVVGKSFESTVLQSDKDVLLMIYAPWCGHCKNLEPIYEQLAEKLKAHKDKIVIAKMDGTANESPSDLFGWSGFPTIFFVKAGEKNPMKYNGQREIEGFIEFLQKNSSKGLKIDTSEASSDGRSEEL